MRYNLELLFENIRVFLFCQFLDGLTLHRSQAYLHHANLQNCKHQFVDCIGILNKIARRMLNLRIIIDSTNIENRISQIILKVIYTALFTLSVILRCEIFYRYYLGYL